jgi:tetratricopeptide (TPR) repeat protein
MDMDNKDPNEFFAPMVVEQPSSTLPALAPMPPRRGFLAFLMRLLGLSPSYQQPLPVLTAGPSFAIGLAALAGDEAPGTHQAMLIQLLENREGVRIRRLNRRPKLDNPADAAQYATAAINARQICTDESLDLLLWGEVVNNAALTLRFTAPSGSEDDRPGNFTLGTRLDLPLMLQPPLDDFLFGCILAAIEPKTVPLKEMRRRQLLTIATAVQMLGQRPPVGMGARQQTAIAICFAHLQAAMVGWEEMPQASKLALDAYRAALKRLPPDEAVEHVAVNRNLAALLMQLAETEDEPVPLMEEAVGSYRTASQRMSKVLGGQDWAALQYRLAQTLYKLETKTGRTDLLRDAILAYQQALTLYTRAETPQRWAECMHGLSLTLQVLGDHLRSAEILQKAVETSESVMIVWNRHTAPAAWAVAANTFATGLFMLAKHAEQWSRLEQAVKVLKDVIEMYETAGATKQAFVAQKNLIRVEALLKEQRARPVADPEWWRIGEDDEPEEPSKLRS